ncbi:MAG: hypothetical protein COV74_04580 [Candidatus Omnitrophica bacterium CG11_big_fil_rev_8_21_14_0_20_45_26]|uniref:Uncharacterized protein n=1 Tax=Candidatus Abzuiibacterium crystallinum TaxID=1974748 RepID=A0A2H0LSI4_9BACT|nr:MAG: hypothetical protein COV74_04580 [Candidatus Omnitrophica bacterium CG11_big_fil_rev_8_21_14_0_20_45_26]PIW64038.1 MAG: hypothetical protein COW12_07705 [Candidatus Omnitrophica bacterium CG12_big_fil_rev_8_21_14_0_65_45_16]
MKKVCQLKKKKMGGWTATDVMMTMAIAGVIILLSYPFYQRTQLNAQKDSLSVAISQIHKIMKDIYMDQNPNQYPPDYAWPNGLTGWATPTNLQNIEDLQDLLKTLCHGSGSGGFPGGAGTYECYYKQRGSGQDYDLLITKADIVAGANKGFKLAYTNTRESGTPNLSNWEDLGGFGELTGDPI